MARTKQLLLFSAFTWNLVFVLGAYVDDSNDIARGFSARTMLEKIASSFMSRTGTTSQVLSLNLTNLLILVLLKALIFAAGAIGVGSLKSGHGHYSRNEDEEEGVVTDTEMLLYLGYLSGSPGNRKCMQNIACQRPKLSADYVQAGKILLKTVHSIPNLINDYTEYELALAELKEATEFGSSTKGGCDYKYPCTNKKGAVTR